MTKIAVHFATGFEEVEAISIVDVLRRAELDVIMVSMTDTKTVVGGHQIPIVTDILFPELDYSTIDVIVLPGGMPGATNLDNHKGLREQILQFNNEKKLLGAICAAPLVLGHLGILKGRKAVCYPGFENELHGAEVLKDPTTVSDNIVTGRGIGVALKFGLALVKEIMHADKAEELSKAMLVE
ncbi:DJ-1 family glyoxalase III [Sunxiuqinia indica]|uniref:DJ-1 family glyoxalase III n=1 Tax=Sunxiuqinia indica TaxID=2692584 RepID=UPI0013587FD4|nr:DJ-1 family glyoxalase III [Sunxiuqinia indica]